MPIRRLGKERLNWLIHGERANSKEPGPRDFRVPRQSRRAFNVARMIPRYIEDRIRRLPPANSGIIPGSTPVVSFGNVQVARVATLGINPSRVEFLDSDDVLLEGSKRRLATRQSLGVTDLAQAPQDTILQVLEDCNQYFGRQPFRKWFDKLTPTLRACDASYYDGTACHLDLVQWATNPIWRKLWSGLRERLIDDDIGFLIAQLQNTNLSVLLINGSGVTRALKRTMRNELDLQAIDEPIIWSTTQSTQLTVGKLFGRIKVIAWSTNIQSSPGVTNQFREESLPKRVAELVVR
jgi:hypothetical protein